MSNLIQESPEPQNPEQHFDSRFSTLCLNPGADHHPPLCSSCGRRPPRSATTPKKRRSPTQIQDPTATTKKLFLDHQQQNLTSFSKIDLPIPFGPSSGHPSSFSPLCRSVSDPTEARNFSPPSSAKRLCPNSALPPQPLRRTVSDPNPSPDKTSESPIKIGKVNDSIKEDSPDSKRLRRIKDGLKEMTQWWNEVMSEQEHEEEKRDGGDKNDTKKRLRRIKDRLKKMNQWWNEVISEQELEEEKRDGGDENDTKKRLRRMKDRLKEMNQWWKEVMSEEEDEEEKRVDGDENDTKKKGGCCKEEEDEEETVGVERVGDSLELRLKCPCGKGFEILLYGTSCFYKLL